MAAAKSPVRKGGRHAVACQPLLGIANHCQPTPPIFFHGGGHLQVRCFVRWFGVFAPLRAIPSSNTWRYTRHVRFLNLLKTTHKLSILPWTGAKTSKRITMTTRYTPFLAAITAASLFITGCNKPSSATGGGGSGSDNTSDVIKVGEFASLTGKEAAFGQSSHAGTQMAVDDLNAAGGVLGKKIQLITEDDQSQGGQPATDVRKLISDDGVVAILGEVASSRSLEAAPICQQNKIPMISPSSTNPKVTEVGDYIFRVCFIDPFQGTVMANFAKNTLHMKTAAVLTDVASDYSMGLAKFFKDSFTANGGTIVADQKYSGGDKDFSAQLTAIKAANPDGIFIPGYYTEVGLIALQARPLGITVPLFGGDGWESSTLISIGGQALEGTYFSTHFTPQDTNAVVQEFVKKYEAKNSSQTPDAMAALGYDSMMILADAMKKAGTTDGAKVRDALAAEKNFPGITGQITIDAQRNASKPAVILEVTNAQYRFVQTISP
jgi:branched-chain amino acid transport system substrate-binding protein